MLASPSPELPTGANDGGATRRQEEPGERVQAAVARRGTNTSTGEGNRASNNGGTLVSTAKGAARLPVCATAEGWQRGQTARRGGGCTWTQEGVARDFGRVIGGEDTPHRLDKFAHRTHLAGGGRQRGRIKCRQGGSVEGFDAESDTLGGERAYLGEVGAQVVRLDEGSDQLLLREGADLVLVKSEIGGDRKRSEQIGADRRRDEEIGGDRRISEEANRQAIRLLRGAFGA